MFGGHFYHATMRNVVSAFGTLFNDINVIRKSASGDVINTVKVPLAYGPRQKFLARIDEQPGDLNDEGRVAIKLPRMSFEITSFAYDTSTNLNSLQRRVTQNQDGSYTRKANYAPYIINMQLNILAKNQDDALQILEQIIPTFQPDYTLTVKYKEDVSVDMPITLDSVTFSDDYEADYSTRRILMYTLDFELKVRFYGPDSGPLNVIKAVHVDFTESDTNKFIIHQGVVATSEDATPLTAEVFEAFLPYDTMYIVTVPGTDGFIGGERVIADSSGAEGVIQVVDSTTVHIKFPDNTFVIGDTITGVDSSVSALITDLTIGNLYG